MATLACTATLYDQRNTTWLTGYSRQGKYQTYVHRGLIVFPQLANNTLRNARINDIALSITSAGAGSASNKTVHIYTTTKTTNSGTSTSWINSANHIGILSGKFYSNTRSFSSLKTSNATLFNNLKSFLESGGQALGLYVDENLMSGKDYSANYLSFTNFVMTVYYEEGNTWYYNGNEWVSCTPYYYDGTSFIQCDTYRYDGSVWTR